MTISRLFLCDPSRPHAEQLREALPSETKSSADVHWLNDDSLEDFSPLPIDEVRSLTQSMTFHPYTSDRSVYILFNIDRCSVAAQNALLKALEEPPAHVDIILTTSQISAVLPTICSRCHIEKLGVSINPSSLQYQSISNDIEVTITNRMSSVFGISERYKERGEAQEFCRVAVEYALKELEKSPSAKRMHQVKVFLQASEYLKQNANVRLVLEDALLAIRS